MNVKILNKSKHGLPAYATDGASCMDIRANLDKDVIIRPLKRELIHTGLYIALPRQYEAQIRPRSGLALKYGITVLNSPGTVDSDYRGELRVLLVNISHDDFCVSDGDRIAQMIILPYTRVTWTLVEVLDVTQRNAGGYGSTGIA